MLQKSCTKSPTSSTGLNLPALSSVVICGILMAVGAVNGAHLTGEAAVLAASGPSVMIGLGIYVIIITIVVIVLTRKAYAKGSSKGWDIAFMVIGICGQNVFYFLGGLFGLIARN